MKITVKTKQEAMTIAKSMLKSVNFWTDDDKSEKAGYPIIVGNVDGEYICDLNARLEVNAGPESINIWIDAMRDITENQIESALEVIDDCIYKIDDNCPQSLFDNTTIGLARMKLYAAYKDIYEIIKEKYPDSKLIAKYNLTEA